jgi:peroxiredoxin
MTASAGEGKHAQLVDGWQQGEEYVSTVQAYLLALKEYSDKREAQDNASNSDSQDSEIEETPRFLSLARELGRIQYGFLNDVASNADNLIDVLLALELGAYRGQEEALHIYDRLAKSLDKDLVSRRVTHRRNETAIHIARTVNDKSLAVGTQAPDFTLKSFDGQERSLSDLLEGKKYVLIDFWASWCGPCIATFPALKELYGSYHERGFEIVSVSIDDSRERWSYSTEEHGLPWTNLGELKGFEGEVVISYGVNFVPKAYLLNSGGNIVQKDLTTDQLKTFLASVYSNANE